MAWRTQQTFGPSPRHPYPCVELHFTLDVNCPEPGPVVEQLRSQGFRIPSRASSAEPVEALGIIAAATLASHDYPDWNWGREGERKGWICLTHPNPRLAEATLILVYSLLTATADQRQEAIAELIKLSSAAKSINEHNLMMMRAARGLQLDTAIVSNLLPVFRVGQASRSVHYCESASQRDGYPANLLSKDKRVTVEVLNRFDLPTTRAVSAANAGQVMEAVRQVGFPCVIKPIAGGSGRGVTAGINSGKHIKAAVDTALRVGGFPLIVENFVEGDDHRLNVVNGQLLWAYRRRPPYVVGDGRSTIGELIDAENRRRREIGEARLGFIRDISLDAAMRFVLEERFGFDESSVPAENQRVELSREANIARGGIADDVTARLHPDNRDLAIRVAQVFRLHTVGIDFITPDIGKSWRETPAAIIEINTSPGMSGVGDASLALRAALPRVLSGRVPCFVITGSSAYRSATATAVLTTLKANGLAASKVEFNDEATGFDDVDELLRETAVEAIVVTCASGLIERFGFPLTRSEVLFSEQADEWAVRVGVAKHIAQGAIAAFDVQALVEEAIEPFVSGTLGGPRPTLEWLRHPVAAEDGAKPARMRSWRVPAIPAVTFWSQLVSRPSTKAGMIGFADLFAAVVYAADQQLSATGREATGVKIDLTIANAPWDKPFIEAEIPLPEDRAQEIESALLHGIATVNRLVDIDR